MSASIIETRKGKPMDLGSCTHCGHGGMTTKNRDSVEITEIILKGITFRLCRNCKASLNNTLT